MNYPSTPEFVADIEIVNGNGDAELIGTKAASLQVSKSKEDIDGQVLLDIRAFKKEENNLQIRIPLSVLVAAISQATLHADRNA